MPNTNVVHTFPPHKVKRGGDSMITYQLGNATVLIDESYIESRSQEQHEIDYARLQNAAWDIVDDLVAAGEEV